MKDWIYQLMEKEHILEMEQIRKPVYSVDIFNEMTCRQKEIIGNWQIDLRRVSC
jgi:hypothetical protein